MTLRVMSFNVRYDEPEDGPDRWITRQHIAARMIRHYKPDLIGMQEPEIDQLRDLDRLLPEYRRFGLSRYGNEEEKFAALMYLKDRLHLLDSGTYWFSETPDEPGTANWLIHKPYAVNWGTLEDMGNDRTIAIHNAQFPYKAEQAEARIRSAQIMRDRSEGKEATVLTGDFNCDAGGEVYKIVRERFSDAIETGKVLGPNGTFHGFKGEPYAVRLDWILHRGFRSVRYETVTYHEDGRYPSDHFPVIADLEFLP